MQSMRSTHLRRAVLIGVLLAALVPVLAGGPGGGSKPAPPPLTRVIVTDVNPATLLHARDGAAAGPLKLNSFDAKSTLDVYVVALYDRTRVGDRPFDERLRLILPDGGTYLNRVIPVDPTALPQAVVTRADLGPHPVHVETPERLLGVGRMLPESVAATQNLREATFVSSRLPVSGTWITQHNLYGKWTAIVTMERGGKAIASETTSFQLKKGN
jgi:hypothetical protein